MELVTTDYPDIHVTEIQLSKLIDLDDVRSMMESFYSITSIPMAIIDLKGNVLAGAGWQDICTKFHRKHPKTFKNCIDSDTKLTADIPEGEFRLYKCRNGMWDMATPLFFEKYRIGNLFTGQFFFTDEEPDTVFFKRQASKYNFNETEYLADLNKVPHLDRVNIEKAKTFMLKLASTLAQIGYAKLKLEKALEDTRVLLSNQMESKFLLEQAALIANLGSWQFDLANNRLVWSNEVFRIFGVSTQEFEPSYEGFLSLIHPDDRDAVAKAYSDSVESGSDGYEIVHRIIRGKASEIRWVHEKCRHFRNESGEITRSVGMAHDITERKNYEDEIKESKEKLNIALEVASIGIWEWQMPKARFLADDRLLSMLGLNRSTFNETFHEFEGAIHEEDISHFRQSISSSLKQGNQFETLVRLKSGIGKIRHINVKALVFKDPKFEETRMFGVCFDITGLREDSEILTNRLNEELLRSNKDLEAFAYVASHDLQEPLRMVASFAQLLEKNYTNRTLDETAQEYIYYVVDGAKRMHSLINGLLSYSRIQTRASEFEKVDINNIVESVRNSLKLIIQERKAILRSEDLPTVLADRNQMMQVFQNLISNSLKFCDHQPVIKISSRKVKSNYFFSIEDNGIGIEPAYYERIFRIFQRLNPKEMYDGTGIGLAICRRIIERHGGRIWVESKMNKGSVFSFTIPCEAN
jgi:PAS domain S-box-containing protein